MGVSLPSVLPAASLHCLSSVHKQIVTETKKRAKHPFLQRKEEPVMDKCTKQEEHKIKLPHVEAPSCLKNWRLNSNSAMRPRPTVCYIELWLLTEADPA